MPKTTDVAIIGGGVIGCSIAYQLAKRGIRSTVFEKDSLGSSASGATGGIIGPIWYVDHTIEPYFDLAMRSLDIFPWLAQDLKDSGVDPEYRPYGVTKVALTNELHEVLKNNLIWQEELGIGVQWIDRDELFERDPHMTPEAQGAVFSPQEANIRGQAYVNSLAHAACKLGATCIEGAEVTGLEFDGDRVIGVRTLTDVYHAKHTVLAAGAWTGLVNRWLPETIPVRPIKGQRITIRMRGFSPMGPVQSIIPQNDGTMFAGASREEGAFDHRITTSAVDGLFDNATLLYPVLKDAEFVGARAGIRPGSPDGMPILGPVPGYEGFSVASGHDHVGIILSPATGVDMAEYIATGDASRLDFFSIERFTDGRPQFVPKTLFSNISYDK
jgi:glycine oxidase